MTTDILMVVHSRPEYSARTLPRLLDVAGSEGGRVWIWWNGTDQEVGEIVNSFTGHPALGGIEHDPSNSTLRKATNWLWANTSGEYLAKVDDDCLVPDGWLSGLVSQHSTAARFGALCAWHYAVDDFDRDLSHGKIQMVGGVEILRNFWVAGSGYVLSRDCVDDCGAIRPGESWYTYCIRASLRGWVFGWPMPLIYQDHLDDPRTLGTGVRSDSDLDRYVPLSARSLGVNTVDDWIRAIRADAEYVQTASICRHSYGNVSRYLRSVRRRLGLSAAASRRQPIY